jgi:hypothetical protein
MAKWKFYLTTSYTTVYVIGGEKMSSRFIFITVSSYLNKINGVNTEEQIPSILPLLYTKQYLYQSQVLSFLVDKTTLTGGVIRTLPPEFVGDSRRVHCV